jgi:septum formation protein
MMSDGFDLILASTSPYRRLLMDRLGLPYRYRPPLVDEDALKDKSVSPDELSLRLAEAKASSLVDQEPRATLIGCDQLVAFRGSILGKPGDANRAVEQLHALAGEWHDLWTSLVVIHGGELRRHTDLTRLKLRTLEREEIERIVAVDQSWDCAGGYKVEGRGTWLFERIETSDPSAIIGLPLLALVTILTELGYAVPA